MLLKEQEAPSTLAKEEFTRKLQDGLGQESIQRLYPAEVFEQDTEEDMYMRGDKLARQVAEGWQLGENNTGFKPSFEVMLNALADHAVVWSYTLEQVMPKELAPRIQVGMVHFAIQILAKTEAADGRHASMRDRSLMRRRFQEAREAG